MAHHRLRFRWKGRQYELSLESDGKLESRHAVRLACRQACRQAGRQIGGHMGRLADMQARGQAGSQAEGLPGQERSSSSSHEHTRS